MATIAEALTQAWQHYHGGNLPQAEHLCQLVLQTNPGNPDALHLLGLAAHRVGQYEVAVDCIRMAVAACPDHPDFHANLGAVYQALGRWEEAVASCRQALRLRPDFPGTLMNLGMVLKEQGKLDEALACLQQAARLSPDSAAILNHQADVLRKQGKLDEACEACNKALQLKPDFVECLNNLGIILWEQKKAAPAIAAFQRAVDLQPDRAEIHNNLGFVFRENGQLAEALGAFQRAIELRPDFAEAINDRGCILKDMGLLDEALAAFRHTLDLRKDSAKYHSNYLYALHFHPDYDAAKLSEEHRLWNDRHAAPLARLGPTYSNNPDPNRRLRVGYVSPDFRSHPVGRFLLPLLEAHDRRAVEVFCYSSIQVSDDLTLQLHRQADHWLDVGTRSDQELAQLVQHDRIDILVDLSAHLAHHRLLTFARKPAPVQVTYLAYCSTTGLQTIDYRLTDPYLDKPPKGEERPDAYYSEESMWLPETYWCYRPVVDLPPAGALPALTSGHVTFGCLNNFCKVTPPTLAAWLQLLQCVQDSRLVLHARPGSHRERIRAYLRESLIAPDRLEFVGFLPLDAYLRVYEGVDIALDPFPYSGGTTTCDALWMGVPVITLAGRTAVARAGLSILSNAGLPELVARTAEEYVRLAADLAGDRPRLASMRAGLRQRLQDSPLMDAPHFARHIEAAYRAMWRRWCASR